ncbi:MAG: tetratricopeptide repeat protein [Chloroflexi bacterium]|nr:tetratricopeptide repeat protein [Chloroflexota bacterium]
MEPLAQGYVLEAGCRLSKSMLWQLQREVYNQQGVQAWSSGSVPQSITTSPFTARAYARVVLGYLRDVDSLIDASAPVYILELGAGSGRFGYRFVKQLSGLLQRSVLQHTSFVYIMTDVSPSMVDYWQTHPSLRPLAESGVVDFAVFDAAHPDEIHLVNSGTVLRPGKVANPMLVVANYLFDSIPQDCFSVGDGVLFENLVSIRSPNAPRPASGPTPPLRDLQVSFESHPTRTEYYADPALDGILDGYRRRLDNVILLFPIEAVHCLDFFHRLADHGVLFLIGDIGTAREGDLSEQSSGGISTDSNFWLSVNFHALGQYVVGLGGKVLHPPSSPANLNISTFILGQSPTDFAETELAYDAAIGQWGPDDLSVTTRMLTEQVEKMSRGQLLTFLRSVAFDPDYVVRCVPLLLDSLPDVSWSGAQDLRLAAAEAWDMYYPMGNDDADLFDLPAGLGVLLYTIGDYAQGLEYFLRSLELVGMDPRTTFNVALCMNRLERREEAVQWLERTLELDPSHEKAHAMRAELLGTPSPRGRGRAQRG